jgi:drug/metabolite transporter (DMT)-like permease
MPRFTWKQLGSIALVAAALSGAPFVLIPAAQEHITSILASLLNATTPLWTAFFVALLIPHERATRAQWIGLLVGVLGIAVLLGAWNVHDFPVWGAILMLSATACYGIGSTLSRMFLSRLHQGPVGISAAQISLSAVMLLPFAFVGGRPASGTFTWGSTAMWGLLLLGVLGTSFSYVMFYRVIAIAGATTGASVTYVVPVVATALGILVLHETLTWNEPVGALVVLAGVWLAQRKPTKSGAITTT